MSANTKWKLARLKCFFLNQKDRAPAKVAGGYIAHDQACHATECLRFTPGPCSLWIIMILIFDYEWCVDNSNDTLVVKNVKALYTHCKSMSSCLSLSRVLNQLFPHLFSRPVRHFSSFLHSSPEAASLRHQPDLVVATPGRLLDHLMNTQSAWDQDSKTKVIKWS